jgi:RNA polymerase sigma factor (sigma-70 family)
MGLEQALPHLPRLRRYARLLTGDAARADDLVQDTLERAHRKWPLWEPRGGDPGASLRAWLLTLMHNLFLNQVRDAHGHLFEELTPGLEPQHEPTAAAADRLDLEQALAQLPAAAREVLLLVCVEEFSYDEAARILGVPIGTVMSRLSRARERMRTLMSHSSDGQAPGLRVVK